MPPSGVTVRRALPGDEPVLRELRIEALSDAPAAFGSTLERERVRSPADWARWLSPSATFLLYAGSMPSGLAAGVPDATDPVLVWLMAMWVRPALRGSGAAGLLVEAIVGWAVAVRADRIRLDVVQGNETARGCYARHGFRPTGHTTIRARDGAIEIQMERAVEAPPLDSVSDRKSAI